MVSFIQRHNQRVNPQTPILTRYTLRQLFISLAVTTSGLSLLIWLMQALHFISLVVEHGLSFPLFIGLTSLLIPSFVAITLPVTVFVVTLFIYNRFTSDHEITVMKGCGLSNLQLAYPGIICAVITTFISAILSIWIVPTSYHKFRQNEYQLRGQVALFMLQEGTFNKISDLLTIYIHDRQKNGVLNHILIQDDRVSGEHATILATSGQLIPSEDSPRLILHQGSRQSLDHKSGHLNILSFNQETIALSQTHKTQRHSFDVVEIATNELFHPNPKLMSQEDVTKFKLEGWRRIITPLECFSFASIGLATVLARQFVITRRENVKRIGLSVLIVCLLLAFIILLQNLASRNISLLFLILLLTIIPGVLSLRVLYLSDRAR